MILLILAQEHGVLVYNDTLAVDLVAIRHDPESRVSRS
jgi:hypothetical protein